MHFSTALIAFVATTAMALPGQMPASQQQGDGQISTSCTTSSTQLMAGGQNAAAPTSTMNKPSPTINGSPAPTTTGQAGTQTMADSQAPSVSVQNKAVQESLSPTKVQGQSSVAPSPNPIFSAAATALPSLLGSNPSDTCTWEFILTCVGQAYQAGDVCLTPLAEASTNCFSQSTCASAVGDNAAMCATCYNSLGKQKFVSACYETKSDSNVAPIFEKLVAYGVCNGQGIDDKA